MDSDERMSRAEREIRDCHEGIRACRVAIHLLNKQLQSLAEAVNTNTDSLSTISDTQQKILTIIRNHQVTISNLIKNPKSKKKFNDTKKRGYIS